MTAVCNTRTAVFAYVAEPRYAAVRTRWQDASIGVQQPLLMRKIAVFTYGIRCVFYGNTDGRMNKENGDAEYSAFRANLDANIEATRGASV